VVEVGAGAAEIVKARSVAETTKDGFTEINRTTHILIIQYGLLTSCSQVAWRFGHVHLL
jgi:phage terminase large subunit-like protein